MITDHYFVVYATVDDESGETIWSVDTDYQLPGGNFYIHDLSKWVSNPSNSLIKQDSDVFKTLAICLRDLNSQNKKVDNND